jgi:Uma2 family endonuclease
MTCARDDLEKGLEPDECWWIANADKLEGRQDVDLRRDPPPDLALEIEVSRRLRERWKIYAALRVPEVWSWDGEIVRFHVLKGRKYRVAARSPAFPFLSSQDLARFAKQMRDGHEMEGLLAFEAWLREER